jgi:DNA-binding beta-propeller fold protein YncE
MISILASLLLAQAPLVEGKTFDCPKGGRFDVLAFDSKFHRVLAAHPGAKTLAVLDTETGKIEEIETGAVNGVAVGGKLNRIFAAGPDQTLVILDRETLKIEKTITLGGPGDVVAVDSKRGQVYVSHDDGTEDWVFDGSTFAPVGNVTIEEAPEFVDYDSHTDRVYQNIKSTNHMQVIDPSTRSVVATWPTAPMSSPHGLFLDKKNGKAYSVGRNGKLVTLDMATGKVLATTEVAPGTDQIAADTKIGRLYSPGSGKLTVVDISGDIPKVIGEISIPKGTHSVTVDSKSHDVWIAYGDDTSAHIMQLKQP